MNITRAKREELNALSKDVFGASSHWQKLTTKGYPELVQEEVTEYVPGEKEGDEGTTRKVMVPVKRSDGAMQYVTKYHTVESIEVYMRERKAQLDHIRAQIAKMQAEAKAKKELEERNKKLGEEASGSAL